VSRSRLLTVLVLGIGTVLVLLLVAVASDLGRRGVLREYIAETGSFHTSGPRAGGPVPGVEADDRPALRIAIAPVISPEKSLLQYFDLAVWLGDRLDRRGDLLLRDNYTQTNQLLRDGECDAALICTYSYVRLARESKVRALAVPVVDGRTTYHSEIIVGARSPYRDILSLRGTHFASADNLSTTGWLYPATYLLDLDQVPETFFATHQLTGSHDLAVAAVANGDVDAAAVHSLVLEQMPETTRRRVRVIHRSPPFGMPPVVAPDTDGEALFQGLHDALLVMHESPEGAAILARIHIERFIDPPAGHYDSISALVDRWEGRR
jgi:phosphonate transport system substrate-binding protein